MMATNLISLNLFDDRGKFSIHISRPLSIYGIFYLLYYVLPYLWLFASGLLPERNELTIAFLILVGFVALHLGLKVSRPPKSKYVPIDLLEKRESFLLLAICTIGIGLVIYAYLWRASEGIFFTQARYYEQELTVAASFRDVFVLSLQLPIILFLGLLSCARHRSTAKISRRLLAGYGGGIFLILVLSSQTRPAITALIFTLIGIRMYRRFVINKMQLVVVGIIGITAVLFIQGVRMADSEEFATAENQISYAFQNIVPSALSGMQESGAEMEERLRSRIGGGMVFLSEIIDKVEEKDGYLYGSGILYSMHSLVPRFIWPNKPGVVPPQLVVEGLLGMPLDDAPLLPITQFYVEGGWVGVIVFYFLFGWLLGKLTNHAVKSSRIYPWIILFFVWGYSVIIEQELVLGILVALRNALMVCGLVWVLLLFARIKIDYSGQIAEGNIPK